MRLLLEDRRCGLIPTLALAELLPMLGILDPLAAVVAVEGGSVFDASSAVTSRLVRMVETWSASPSFSSSSCSSSWSLSEPEPCSASDMPLNNNPCGLSSNKVFTGTCLAFGLGKVAILGLCTVATDLEEAPLMVLLRLAILVSAGDAPLRLLLLLVLGEMDA